ncbi:MAG: transcription elongation factor GreA [Candidatus Brocadiaceae bacterium]|nr:transcription elongation factor GreA [Candidatus Brocadiaceae bacterium]
MSSESSVVQNPPNATELMHFVNTEQYDKLEDGWLEIIESDIQNLSALFEVIDQLYKRSEKKRAHDLLLTLETYFNEKGRYYDVLDVLKKILKYNPKEKGIGKRLAECYLQIYKDRAYVRDFVDESGIETTSNIDDAVKKLEKSFFLDRGDYVNHKSWGVGQVVSVGSRGEKVTINFEKKSNHSIATDIAPDILQKLENNNLLVMKYAQKELLHQMMNEDPVNLVKLALRYFKGKPTLSNIKMSLTPDIIPAGAWTKWWTNTKKLIKRDPYIKFTDGSPSASTIEMRTSPITLHQEILERLIHTGNTNKRIEITRKYLSEIEPRESCRETLSEITSLFEKDIEILREKDVSLAIECMLILEQIQSLYKKDSQKYKEIIESLLRANENLPELIDGMMVLEYKKQTLAFVKEALSDKWQDLFASFFFTAGSHLWEFIMKELIAGNKQDSIEGILHKIFTQFNAYPEHYIWLCKNIMSGKYPELYRNIDSTSIFIRLIELSDNIYFKIQKGQEGDLKSTFNKILNLLEEKGIDYALKILSDTNAETIYNVVSRTKGLEDSFKMGIESAVRDRFPDIIVKTGDSSPDENKIYVTKEGYEKRQNEFDHLMHVEFPENASDLGEAISLGDLRENAEYKAARERQAMLVEKAERMKAELQKVVLIEPHTINPNTITPGTKVTLKHQGTGTREIYKLLGPWDVDIDKGIISYLAPIGKGLLGKTTGDVVTIDLPEGESTYEILKIEKAL